MQEDWKMRGKLAEILIRRKIADAERTETAQILENLGIGKRWPAGSGAT